MYLTQFAQSYTSLDTSYGPTTTTTSSSLSGGVVALIILLSLAVAAICIASMWVLYKRAGRPGWASIVPLYNVWVLFELTGFPGWLAILMLVPFVNFVVGIIEIVAIVKFVQLFGKGVGFGILTIFFPFVMLPILAFGKAQYQGPAAGPGNSTDPSQPVAPQPLESTPLQPVAPSQSVGPQPPEQQPPVPPAPTV
jgi:hypothetical protein